MGYFDNTRKNWIIGLLAILNIGLLTSMLLPNIRNERPGPPHRGKDKISRQLKKELNLDNVQFNKVQTLREEHFQETRAIHDHIERLKGKMFDPLKGENPNTNEAYQIANEIGKLESDIDKLVINHFLDLKEVCNAEQKQKLDEIFHEAIQKHHGKPGQKGKRPPPRNQ